MGEVRVLSDDREIKSGSSRSTEKCWKAPSIQSGVRLEAVSTCHPDRAKAVAAAEPTKPLAPTISTLGVALVMGYSS